jgi:hypothetical protein
MLSCVKTSPSRTGQALSGRLLKHSSSMFPLFWQSKRYFNDFNHNTHENVGLLSCLVSFGDISSLFIVGDQVSCCCCIIGVGCVILGIGDFFMIIASVLHESYSQEPLLALAWLL